MTRLFVYTPPALQHYRHVIRRARATILRTTCHTPERLFADARARLRNIRDIERRGATSSAVIAIRSFRAGALCRRNIPRTTLMTRTLFFHSELITPTRLLRRAADADSVYYRATMRASS